MLQPEASANDALRVLYQEVEARLRLNEDYVAMRALSEAIQEVESPRQWQSPTNDSKSVPLVGQELTVSASLPTQDPPAKKDARFLQETLGRMRMKGPKL